MFYRGDSLLLTTFLSLSDLVVYHHACTTHGSPFSHCLQTGGPTTRHLAFLLGLLCLYSTDIHCTLQGLYHFQHSKSNLSILCWSHATSHLPIQNHSCCLWICSKICYHIHEELCLLLLNTNASGKRSKTRQICSHHY